MSRATGPVSRRALVRAAAPMVLSLGSGAALARSSNLISESSPADAVDLAGNTLCLDGRYVYSISDADAVFGDTVYDLGSSPVGQVYSIPAREYHFEKNNSPASVIQVGDMCKRGGIFYYNEGAGWQTVNLPQGILVSAQAINSFGSAIIKIDV